MKDTKRSKSYPLEQHALIIMDTFKGQDNDTLKMCAENNCDVVIVPHSRINKLLPLNSIQNKYNDWFADQVFTQRQNGKEPTDVKISSKLSDLKPTHGRWIFDWKFVY